MKPRRETSAAARPARAQGFTVDVLRFVLELLVARQRVLDQHTHTEDVVT